MVLMCKRVSEENPFGALETIAEPMGKRYFVLRATALGTACQIMFSATTRAVATEFRQRAGVWLGGFEARYSRFRSDSLIARINRLAAQEAVEIDEELDGIFRLCDWFYWSSKGLFDPTMMPLNDLWGFASEEGCQVDREPDPAAVVEARERVGWRQFHRTAERRVRFTRAGMGVDIGGIGKEYAVDRVAEMALDLGIRDILVDFGHDVRAHGSPPEGGPWRIGLEDPRDPGRCYTGIALSDRAVATSGYYLRFRTYGGETFGHLLDPRTGYPARTDCLSASIIAPTCTEAGVVASCCCILGSEEGVAWIRPLHQVTGACITKGCVVRLPGFECLEIAGKQHRKGEGR
jgi:thiamine biosynthesis lipoprotein